MHFNKLRIIKILVAISLFSSLVLLVSYQLFSEPGPGDLLIAPLMIGVFFLGMIPLGVAYKFAEKYPKLASIPMLFYGGITGLFLFSNLQAGNVHILSTLVFGGISLSFIAGVISFSRGVDLGESLSYKKLSAGGGIAMAAIGAYLIYVASMNLKDTLRYVTGGIGAVFLVLGLVIWVRRKGENGERK